MKFLSQINVNTEYTLPIVDGTNGQVLTTDGSGAVYWGSVGIGALNLDGLQDVVITTPTSGQILRYGIPVGSEDPNPVWYNWSPNYLTFSSSIDALGDVAIASATTGQLLQWNGSAWVNWTPNYLTSYTETDTLATVTTRGNTTTNTITVGGATSNYLILSGASSLLESKGLLKWESDHNSVGIYYADGKHFDIGQSQMWYVKNTSDATLTKGTVVMATGAVGNSGKLEVQPLIADGSISGRFAIGIAMDDIAVGAFGFVKTEGTIRGIDTSEYTIGTVLYADPAIAGGLTSIEPTAPSLKLAIAFVVSAANNGAIGVRMTQGLDLHEIHDVTISSVANGQLLRYNAGVWSNWTPNFLTAHPPISNGGSVNNSLGTVVQDITVDANGHVTAIGSVNLDTRYYTQDDISAFFGGDTAIAGYNLINWDTAYSWGNHASAGYATTSYVTTAIANLVDAAPSTLDTLNELAAALGDDPNFATTVTNSIATKVPQTRTLTINGTAFDLSADRSWTISSADGYISDVRLVETTLTFEGEGNAFAGDIDLSTLPFAPQGSYLTAEADTLQSVTTRGSSTTAGATFGGSVGIGTTSPSAKLDIQTSSTNLGLRLGNTNGTNWDFYSYNDSNLYINNAAGTQLTILNSNGNVGIGTAAPVTKLHVDYTSGTGLTLSNTQANLYAEMRFQSANSSAFIFKSSNGYTPYGGANALNVFNEGQIAFHSSTVSNIMYLTAAGNVGIGTTNPQHGLHISKNQNQVAAFQSPNGNTWIDLISTAGTWSMGATSNNTWAIYQRGAVNATEFEVSESAAFISGEKVATQDWVTAQGYLTSETDSQTLSWDPEAKNLSISNGNTVTLDGLVTEEFVTSQGYITGYTETDTLATVTGRGATTSSKVFFTHNATTDPLSAVEINGGGTHTGLYINPAADSQAHVRFGTNGNLKWQIRAPFQVGSDTSLNFYSWVSAADKFQFEHSGNAVFNGGNVWTSANDGSGSGLDADTVDGIQAASFLRSDADDSFSGTLTMSTQKALVASNYGHGVYGVYDASIYQHVWSMGTAYNLPANGASSGNGGNLYGLAWSYNPNYGYSGSNAQSKSGLNHQLLLMMNGVTHTALGSGIWTNGLITTVDYGTSANWNTAYGWGNHADASYIKADSAEPLTIQAETVTFTGSVTVEGTFTESSSIRFKENITPLDPALDKVNQLEAVSYNKIGADEREIGLIAEDVAELFPEVVTYNEEGQPQGIQYQRLSVILLKAVQELSQEVNELKKKLN